ncbi:MAG TPA: 4-alpha-glucanotransferase, partial [Candidatus Omnitrophota bacterium]|nr:4-alpha-glucanotransferase [Candidatus Omnitrophota bacterium]
MAYILSAQERSELLEKFKRQAAMLDALSVKEPLNIHYEVVSNTGNEYKLKLAAAGPVIRQGDVVCVADMPSVLRVNRVEGRIIDVADESGSEEVLQSSGVLVHTPRDVTYDIQRSALQKIIKSMESSGCRTTGFAIVDHMLGLSADIARTPAGFMDNVVSFYDNKIVRRQSRDGEGLEYWSGDESQEAAVKLALSPSKLKVVHGPPGTGKTVVIAEMIRQYARQGKKVLLVSQMNQALDNALQMVMDDVPALRLGNDIEPLKKYGTDKIWIHDPEAVSRFELKKGRSKGFVFAATDIGVVSDNAGLRRVGEKGFDVVIMDESSRETFAGALVPLQYLKDDGQCILVGDTKQLEPFISLDEIDALRESGFTAEEIESFGRSILALVEGGGIADEVMLSTNWRSRPLITGLFSELFYDGDIHRRGWEDFTPDTLSLKIIDMDNPEGQYYEEPVGTSYQNTKSAGEVMGLIDHYLRNKGVPMDKITVITALKPQADLIRNLARSKYGTEMPHITTIDSYQGGENDTVIIDFVRSNPHGAIGFIKDLHRLNVALSRAEENMAIVWDSRVFMRDPDYISREDAPARDVFRKMREYYIKEVAQFFPDEYPSLAHAPLPSRRHSATYLGMNLFIPHSWIRPDGGIDWNAIWNLIMRIAGLFRSKKRDAYRAPERSEGLPASGDPSEDGTSHAPYGIPEGMLPSDMRDHVDKIERTLLRMLYSGEKERHVSWLHGTENVRVNMRYEQRYYGFELNVFPVFTGEEYEKYHHRLYATHFNYPGIKRGSIGRMLFSAAYIDGEPALVIREIQTTEAFRHLPPSIRERYDIEWITHAASFIAAIGRTLGMKSVYSLTGQSVRAIGHYEKLNQQRNTYERPFRDWEGPARHRAFIPEFYRPSDRLPLVDMFRYDCGASPDLAHFSEYYPSFIGFADFYPEISGDRQTMTHDRTTYVTVDFDKPLRNPGNLMVMAHYGDPWKKDRWQDRKANLVDTYEKSYRFAVKLPKGVKEYTFKVSYDGGKTWGWMGRNIKVADTGRIPAIISVKGEVPSLWNLLIAASILLYSSRSYAESAISPTAIFTGTAILAVAAIIALAGGYGYKKYKEKDEAETRRIYEEWLRKTDGEEALKRHRAHYEVKTPESPYNTSRDASDGSLSYDDSSIDALVEFMTKDIKIPGEKTAASGRVFLSGWLAGIEYCLAEVRQYKVLKGGSLTGKEIAQIEHAMHRLLSELFKADDWIKYADLENFIIQVFRKFHRSGIGVKLNDWEKKVLGDKKAEANRNSVPDNFRKDFAVLGLKPGVSWEETRRAWLKLCHKYHPDKTGGDKAMEEVLKNINDAYSNLEKAHRMEFGIFGSTGPVAAAGKAAAKAMKLFLDILPGHGDNPSGGGTYLGMNLFIPRSWIRPDGGLDLAKMKSDIKSVLFLPQKFVIASDREAGAKQSIVEKEIASSAFGLLAMTTVNFIRGFLAMTVREMSSGLFAMTIRRWRSRLFESGPPHDYGDIFSSYDASNIANTEIPSGKSSSWFESILNRIDAALEGQEGLPKAGRDMVKSIAGYIRSNPGLTVKTFDALKADDPKFTVCYFDGDFISIPTQYSEDLLPGDGQGTPRIQNPMRLRDIFIEELILRALLEAKGLSDEDARFLCSKIFPASYFMYRDKLRSLLDYKVEVLRAKRNWLAENPEMARMVVYEFNTAITLNNIVSGGTKDATLEDIPGYKTSPADDAGLFDHLKRIFGVNVIWPMGVKARDRIGEAIARASGKQGGSPYALMSNKPDERWGGRDAYEAFQSEARKRGFSVAGDWVSNHLGFGSEFIRDERYRRLFIVRDAEDEAVKSHPDDWYVYRPNPQSPDVDVPELYGKAVLKARERGGYLGTGDVAQISLHDPESWEMLAELIEEAASEVCGKEGLESGLLRFDLAHYLWRDSIYSRTRDYLTDEERLQFASNFPGLEFWEYAIPRLKKRFPKLTCMAEVYGGPASESHILAIGFDIAYDKEGGIYEFLVDRRNTQEINVHLRRMAIYARSGLYFMGFLENHDEPSARYKFYDRVAHAAALFVARLSAMPWLIYGDEEDGIYDPKHDAEDAHPKKENDIHHDPWRSNLYEHPFLRRAALKEGRRIPLAVLNGNNEGAIAAYLVEHGGKFYIGSCNIGSENAWGSVRLPLERMFGRYTGDTFFILRDHAHEFFDGAKNGDFKEDEGNEPSYIRTFEELNNLELILRPNQFQFLEIVPALKTKALELKKRAIKSRAVPYSWIFGKGPKDINPHSVWWRDPTRIHVAASVPIYGLRLEGKKDAGIGKYTYIAPYAEKELLPYGINTVLLLPFLANLTGAPYEVASSWALQEAYIDWSEAEEVRGDKALLSMLVAPEEAQRHVDQIAVEKRERPVALEAYKRFTRSKKRIMAFEKFLAEDSYRKAKLEEYAEFMALYEILGKPSMEWVAEEIEKAKEDERYGLYNGFHLYAQWIADGQLKQAIMEIHRYGGKVGADMPGFRAKDGPDVYFNRDKFIRPEDPDIYPGVVKEGVNERWRSLALWNYVSMAAGNFSFIIDPIKNLLNRYDFDMMRLDAFNFFYPFEGQLFVSEDNPHPGNALIDAVRAVFDNDGAMPVAEAMDRVDEKIRALGVPVVRHKWENPERTDGWWELSNHDFPLQESTQYSFMDEFLRRLNKARYASMMSRIINVNLYDLWGDTRSMKRTEGDDGKTFWDTRIPVAGDPDYKDRFRYDARPLIAREIGLSHSGSTTGDVYLGMNLFIPRSWIRPDGGLDWNAIRNTPKAFAKFLNRWSRSLNVSFRPFFYIAVTIFALDQMIKMVPHILD